MINRAKIARTTLTRSRRTLCVWLVLLVASACGFEESDGGCGGSLINNYRFDRWCGDQLCNWTTLTGAESVQRAPTWHDNDYGVALVGTPTVITQKRFLRNEECLEFEMVADIEATANVVLGLDYNFDGDPSDPADEADVSPDLELDATVALPTAKWKKLTFLFTMPRDYYGVRFVIRKSGEGRAILAEVRAQSSDACTGEQPVLDELPVGVSCSDPSACVTGHCSTTTPKQALVDLCEFVSPEEDCEMIWDQGPYGDGAHACGECGQDGQCPGQVCGVVDGPRGAYRSCVAPAEIGSRCVDDAHCQSGICNPIALYTQSWLWVDTGTCGECASDADCAGDEICGLDAERHAQVCMPRGQKPLSSLCETNLECGSGICCGGRCSECCTASALGECTDTCVTRTFQRDGQDFETPFVCEQRTRQASGAECFEDGDCESGSCGGASDECTDEQRCLGSQCQPYASNPCDRFITIAGTCQ